MKGADMRTLFVAMVVCAMFFGGCTSVDSSFRAGYDFGEVGKVAVVGVYGDVYREGVKNQIADFFAMELLRKGYAPVERAQVAALLEEQDFQAGDITSAEDAVEAGRILNVPAVVIVNIPTFTEEMNLTAKLLDVEDASILWMASGSGSTGETAGTILGAIGGAAAGAAVAGEGNEAVGAVAGGVVGGVAGQTLAPQKAQKVQDLIKKMCESLPPAQKN